MDAKYATLRTIEDISILKGTAFEEFLEAIFGELGYSVDLTPSSGDYGADLILKQDDRKIVVQAKQYAKPVGFNAVKEIHFARTYYSATDAWVIATHGFTQQAIDAAAASDVRLIDGTELLSLVIMANEDNAANEEKKPPKPMLIDADLLKASCLLIEGKTTLPGYLEEKMSISFEKASKLLSQMESIGIITTKPSGKKAIISNEDFVHLVDEYYDPASSKPRFSSQGHPYEVFRGEDPESIVIVDNPTTYPSFFNFEYDRTALYSDSWVCVGIDQISDLYDMEDVAERRDKVSGLKLYDVVNLTDRTECEYDLSSDRMQEVRICKDYNAIEWAFDKARTGKTQVQKPGYVKRKLDERKKEKDKRLALAQAQEQEREEWRKELEKENKAKKIKLAIIAVFVILALILKSLI